MLIVTRVITENNAYCNAYIITKNNTHVTRVITKNNTNATRVIIENNTHVTRVITETMLM